MKLRVRKAGRSPGKSDSNKEPRKPGGIRLRVRKADKRPPKPEPSPPEDGRKRRGKFIGQSVDESMRNKDFKSLIRCLFDKPSGEHQTKRAKDRLAKVAMKKALKGDYFFWAKLVDLHESDLVNEDDLAEFTERIYLIVRRHVEKLDGGSEALADIARDLVKEKV